MDFTYRMPTKIVFGRDCVRKSGALLSSLGGHALIVTGRSSKRNGALDDLLFALSENGQDATVFDRVTPNPGLSCVREGIALLESAGADFVVGVGGGSPMDAAKAIALLSVETRGDGAVFQGNYGGCALPLAMIPTTAGTGSEVTPYSVLTDGEGKTKRSIYSEALFPRLAFLDGKYTDALPETITKNTALDAFSHAAESLLSRAATPFSRLLAVESAKVVYPYLPRLSRLSKNDRDALLFASSLAGMAIAQSGTTAVHGLGYCLTYFCGIDHGRANALLLGEALRLAREKGADLSLLEGACGESAEEIALCIDKLVSPREVIPREVLLDFAARSRTNKNIAKSVYEPSPKEVERIFLRSFGIND